MKRVVVNSLHEGLARIAVKNLATYVRMSPGEMERKKEKKKKLSTFCLGGGECSRNIIDLLDKTFDPHWLHFTGCRTVHTFGTTVVQVLLYKYCTCVYRPHVAKNATRIHGDGMHERTRHHRFRPPSPSSLCSSTNSFKLLPKKNQKKNSIHPRVKKKLI